MSITLCPGSSRCAGGRQGLSSVSSEAGVLPRRRGDECLNGGAHCVPRRLQLPSSRALLPTSSAQMCSGSFHRPGGSGAGPLGDAGRTQAALRGGAPLGQVPSSVVNALESLEPSSSFTNQRHKRGA